MVESMLWVSYLGKEEFYLFVAPVVYWCISASVGLRLGLSLMISTSLNAMLKLVMRGPRPYWYHPEVRAFSSETSFGSPSAHAQNAVVVWGLLASWIKKPWAWVIAILIILLTGLSRMVLGVHFPHDVVIGYLVGILVLWAFISLEIPVYNWLKGKSSGTQVGLSFVFSLLVILLGTIARFSSGEWSLPVNWISLAAKAAPGAAPIAPLELSSLITPAGVFFGLACGAIWLKRGGWYDAKGSAWQLIARFLIGIAGVFLLWMGLGALFPRGEVFLPLALRYLRYALVGLWVAGIAPLLFIRFGLAKRAS